MCYMAEILPIRRKTQFNQSICFVLFERFCRMKIIYLEELFLKDSFYLLMLKSSFPNNFSVKKNVVLAYYFFCIVICNTTS